MGLVIRVIQSVQQIQDLLEDQGSQEDRLAPCYHLSLVIQVIQLIQCFQSDLAIPLDLQDQVDPLPLENRMDRALRQDLVLPWDPAHRVIRSRQPAQSPQGRVSNESGSHPGWD